jgi:hypothetical protein
MKPLHMVDHGADAVLRDKRDVRPHDDLAVTQHLGPVHHILDDLIDFLGAGLLFHIARGLENLDRIVIQVLVKELLVIPDQRLEHAIGVRPLFLDEILGHIDHIELRAEPLEAGPVEHPDRPRRRVLAILRDERAPGPRHHHEAEPGVRLVLQLGIGVEIQARLGVVHGLKADAQVVAALDFRAQAQAAQTTLNGAVEGHLPGRQTARILRVGAEPPGAGVGQRIRFRPVLGHEGRADRVLAKLVLDLLHRAGHVVDFQLHAVVELPGGVPGPMSAAHVHEPPRDAGKLAVVGRRVPAFVKALQGEVVDLGEALGLTLASHQNALLEPSPWRGGMMRGVSAALGAVRPGNRSDMAQTRASTRSGL